MITLKQLKEIAKEEELTIKDLNNDREYIDRLFKVLEERGIINYSLNLTGNNCSDWWLQCEYYSEKIGKAIIWNYDYDGYYEDWEDLLETINTTKKEIQDFEMILPDLSTYHYSE